jgi:hypothetical protein
MLRPTVRISLLLFVASLACQLFLSYVGTAPGESVIWRQHLGGEYFNIAQAIVDGRGFADPFGEATGPTAWMPPLFPAILALLLVVTKSRIVVAAVVVTLTSLSITTVGVTVYSIARRHARAVPPAAVIFFLLIWMAAFDKWFLLTHDIWLTILAANGILILIYRHVELGETKRWAWILGGGVLLLVSPTLVLPWVLVIAYFAVRDRQWRRWGAIVGAVMVIGVPWLVRNAVTMHAFIPVKSNLGYDAYQSNVQDEDGVQDLATLIEHPYGNSLTRFEYARLGEVAYNKHYGAVFFEYVRQHPGAVMRKAVNRLIAATVYYRSLAGDEHGAKLVFVRIVYCVPLVAFVLLVLLSKRHRKLAAAYGLFCASYLGLYVLIAFCVRYWLPLTPVFTLITFLAMDTVVARVRERRTFRANDPAPYPT